MSNFYVLSCFPSSNFEYEWFIVGIKLNSSIAKECFSLSCFIQFCLSSSYCSLSESSSGSFALHLYLELQRKLRMTSPLLIFLVSREESNWVLTTLPLIRGLWTHQIQWKCGNVGITYKLLGSLGYFHSPSL